VFLRGGLQNTGQGASPSRNGQIRRRAYFDSSLGLLASSRGHGHERVTRAGNGGYVFYLHEAALGLRFLHLAVGRLTSILPWNFLNNSQIILQFCCGCVLGVFRRLTGIVMRLFYLLVLCLLLASLHVLFELRLVAL